MSKASPKLVHEAYGSAKGNDGPTRTWATSHAMYIAGRSHVDEVDALAIEMEAKWGCDRLRLLVPTEMREKFDRQRYLMNQAIWHGDLEAVRRESGRMVKAWRVLDRLATEAGKTTLPKDVWEVPMSDGRVVAIVPDNHRASMVIAEGRRIDVYTLEEIARLLDGYPGLAKIKQTFPGATVTAVRKSVDDPLEAVGDTKDELNDPIPF